jgi:hypothetical protein
MKTMKQQCHISHPTCKNKNINAIKCNGKIINTNNHGWKQIEIWGSAYKRGYAHGYLLSNELSNVLKQMSFLVHENFKISLNLYLKICKRIISPIVKKYYREFFNEIEGIKEGAKEKGIHTTTDFLIAWNAFSSMFEYFENAKNRKKTLTEKCSAFIACGEGITETGNIVMAHNTHTDLVSGSFFNVIIKLIPENGNGNTILMQTCAGYISSVSDWFVCSNGIIGCETTISDAKYNVSFNSEHHPFFCRIRKSMQYSNSLDDYVNNMVYKNAGDYPCSWLLGNINTNEIMMLELGLKYYNVEKTKNGIYYGMNSVFNYKIQTFETNDTELFDLQTTDGSRNARMHSLLTNKYFGKINVKNAKNILSDHYDTYENKHTRDGNGICKHTYLNDDSDNYPHGCVDGKVVTSETAKQMKFYGRWGSSCGYKFNATRFIEQNPKYKYWEKHLPNFPTNPWTIL